MIIKRKKKIVRGEIVKNLWNNVISKRLTKCCKYQVVVKITPVNMKDINRVFFKLVAQDLGVKPIKEVYLRKK